MAVGVVVRGGPPAVQGGGARRAVTAAGQNVGAETGVDVGQVAVERRGAAGAQSAGAQRQALEAAAQAAAARAARRALTAGTLQVICISPPKIKIN